MSADPLRLRPLEPEAVEAGAHEPEAVEPETVEPEASEFGAGEPGTAEPEVPVSDDATAAAAPGPASRTAPEPGRDGEEEPAPEPENSQEPAAETADPRPEAAGDPNDDEAEPGDPRRGARRAAEEAGRRSGPRPAASLLAIAPKPRRRPADTGPDALRGAPGDSGADRPGEAPTDGAAHAASGRPPPAIPGLPTTGKRDLTAILRALNDPAAGEVPFGATEDPTLAEPAAPDPSLRPAPDPAPDPTSDPVADLAPPQAPDGAPIRATSPPPVVRLTPVAPPSAVAAPPQSPDVPSPAAAAPLGQADRILAADDDEPLLVFEEGDEDAETPADGSGIEIPAPAARTVEPRAEPAALPTSTPEPSTAAAPTTAAPAPVPPTPAAPTPAAPTPAASTPAAKPTPAEPRRFGWRGLAARAARVVAGSRSRDADAVARRQEAMVAAVRQRDEAVAARPAAPAHEPAVLRGAAPAAGAAEPVAEASAGNASASTAPAAATASAAAASEGGAAAIERADAASGGPRPSGPPAGTGAEPPVTLLRRGEGGLVGARRMRPGPRGPEDLIRLWLERRGPRMVPAWSAFPASLVGAQWPNSLLLTIDPEAAPDGDAAGAFAAIVRLDRTDRPRPAEAPRIVYTPTMTEWILAIAREAARSARMLRDADEFMSSDGRLALTLVALPLGEEDGTVDKVLCHLAAGPS